MSPQAETPRIHGPINPEQANRLATEPSIDTATQYMAELGINATGADVIAVHDNSGNLQGYVAGGEDAGTHLRERTMDDLGLPRPVKAEQPISHGDTIPGLKPGDAGYDAKVAQMNVNKGMMQAAADSVSAETNARLAKNARQMTRPLANDAITEVPKL